MIRIRELKAQTQKVHDPKIIQVGTGGKNPVGKTGTPNYDIEIRTPSPKQKPETVRLLGNTTSCIVGSPPFSFPPLLYVSSRGVVVSR